MRDGTSLESLRQIYHSLTGSDMIDFILYKLTREFELYCTQDGVFGDANVFIYGLPDVVVVSERGWVGSINSRESPIFRDDV
jgi:hypothetical protein